jgi:rhomboid family GlyGly-CTERM serine protease
MNTVLHVWVRSYGFWLVLLLVCFFIKLMALDNIFRFDRSLIDQGHLWLIMSGHLAHLNWGHLGLNMAGLALVAVFFSRYISVLQWLLLSLFSALWVGLGLYWLNGDIYRYVGMSGVLHGLFIVGAWYEFRRYPLSGGVLLVMIVAKLIWEQIAGALPGSESMAGGHVVVDAHFYGAISGAVFLLAISYFGNRSKDAAN